MARLITFSSVCRKMNVDSKKVRKALKLLNKQVIDPDHTTKILGSTVELYYPYNEPSVIEFIHSIINTEEYRCGRRRTSGTGTTNSGA